MSEIGTKKQNPYFDFNSSIQHYQAFERWKNLDPIPRLTIEPSKHWTGRWVITITQEQVKWELSPSLIRAEALDLESMIRRQEICFELDLNQGTPLANEAIHSLVEVYLNCSRVFASKRQAKKAAEPAEVA